MLRLLATVVGGLGLREHFFSTLDLPDGQQQSSTPDSCCLEETSDGQEIILLGASELKVRNVFSTLIMVANVPKQCGLNGVQGKRKNFCPNCGLYCVTDSNYNL